MKWHSLSSLHRLSSPLCCRRNVRSDVDVHLVGKGTCQLLNYGRVLDSRSGTSLVVWPVSNSCSLHWCLGPRAHFVLVIMNDPHQNSHSAAGALEVIKHSTKAEKWVSYGYAAIVRPVQFQASPYRFDLTSAKEILEAIQSYKHLLTPSINYDQNFS